MEVAPTTAAARRAIGSRSIRPPGSRRGRRRRRRRSASALRQWTPWTSHSAIPQCCDISGTQPRQAASSGAKPNGSRCQVGKAKTSYSGVEPGQLRLRAASPGTDDVLVQAPDSDQRREVGVVDVAVDVDREVLEAPVAEPGGGLDQEVDPLVACRSIWPAAEMIRRVRPDR